MVTLDGDDRAAQSTVLVVHEDASTVAFVTQARRIAAIVASRPMRVRCSSVPVRSTPT